MINRIKAKRWLLCAASLLGVAALLTGSAVLGAEDEAEEIAPLLPEASYDYTVKKDIEGTAQSETLLETDRLVCENDRLALYVDEEEFILKVLDKQGDYLWSSGAAENEAQQMTGTWRLWRISSAVSFARFRGLVKAMSKGMSFKASPVLMAASMPSWFRSVSERP